MPNELPIRKSIRLPNFDYSQAGCFFITICTQDRRYYFGEIVGASLCGRPNHPHIMIESWLLELKNKYDDVNIVEYVIMPNHVHFIIEKTDNHVVTGDYGMGDHAGSPLRDIVGWFKTMTTNDYIKGVKQGLFEPFEKRLWQRNYYEHVIRDEQDYIAIAEYIRNNPAKWEFDALNKEI